MKGTPPRPASLATGINAATLALPLDGRVRSEGMTAEAVAHQGNRSGRGLIVIARGDQLHHRDRDHRSQDLGVGVSLRGFAHPEDALQAAGLRE